MCNMTYHYTVWLTLYLYSLHLFRAAKKMEIWTTAPLAGQKICIIYKTYVLYLMQKLPIKMLKCIFFQKKHRRPKLSHGAVVSYILFYSQLNRNIRDATKTNDVSVFFFIMSLFLVTIFFWDWRYITCPIYDSYVL